MSTTPVRPDTAVDEKTRRIIEQRLLTADDEPTHDARDAVEEIRTRRKLKPLSPRWKSFLTGSAKFDGGEGGIRTPGRALNPTTV